ncbi:hypothetical protein [Phenylobacterium sp.]|uniref:hypothetical protein n=1 Tax=Phenylobacterium sp. TaxID=1871053 RepID=UPI00121ABCC1|nr:hypothetical protein [Phenylobacterium sp.]THD70610.1 MAG: hypothetical protein E8A12_02840 [Phenylobacterium sp.]
MSRRLLSVLLIGAAFSGSLMTTAARAADRDFCRNYAEAAVRQSRAADEHDRCHRAVRDDPARWSSDIRVHMDWCRDAKIEDADREREARKHVLDDCARR